MCAQTPPPSARPPHGQSEHSALPPHGGASPGPLLWLWLSGALGGIFGPRFLLCKMIK